MYKFVQIYNGKAHWIFEASSIPEFASDIIIKDITNVDPQPKEGWDYDSETDIFIEPDIPSESDIPSEPKPPTLDEKVDALGLMLVQLMLK